MKRLLRSRGRALLGMFGRRGERRNPTSLRMEEFMTAADSVRKCFICLFLHFTLVLKLLQFSQVDGVHRALLVSSSDEDWVDDESEEEDEEVVFAINKRTGEWEGEEGVSLLGGEGVGGRRRRKKRRRRRKSSSESSGSMMGLSSAVSRDLVRLSSEEDSCEEEMMVKVG